MSRFISRPAHCLLAISLLVGSVVAAASDGPSAEPARKQSASTDGQANSPSLLVRGAQRTYPLPVSEMIETPPQWDRLDPSVIERNTKSKLAEKPPFPAERP